MAESIFPSPGVEKLSRPSLMKRKATPGRAMATWVRRDSAKAPSVASFFRNLARAGTLKKRSLTTMVVPTGQPVSPQPVSSPASRESWTPSVRSAVRVKRSTRDTEAMAASASPRKPRVPMAARSRSVRILEVA